MAGRSGSYGKNFYFGKGSGKRYASNSFAEQVAVQILKDKLLKYEKDIRSIISSINIPANNHNGVIDLTNYTLYVKPISKAGSVVSGELRIIYSHGPNVRRRSISIKKHSPVDMMYLFNNGWQNAYVIPDYTGQSKYKTTRSSTPVTHIGDYPGDGFMNEIESRFLAMHPEATVTLNKKYKEPFRSRLYRAHSDTSSWD